MPAFQREEFAPPEESLKPRVNFCYTRGRVQSQEFWQNEAQAWARAIEGFIGKSEKARALGKELSAGSKDASETLAKAYTHVQAMRNYSFEADRSEEEIEREKIRDAKNAEQVLRKGAGFRDEITRVFVAIAREAGLNADVVRVAPRDRLFFSAKLADAEQISAEIAVVDIDGQPVYLDPGTPHAPLGVLSWEKSTVPGFRISKKSPPNFVTLPTVLPASSVTKRTADLRVDGETLVGNVTVTWTGQDALIHRLRNLNDDEATRQKALEDEMKQSFPEGATAKMTKVTGVATHAEPLVAVFEVSLPNVISRAGSRMVMPLSVFETTAKNPFASEKRAHPIYFAYPWTEEDEVRITLPENHEIVAVPQPTELAGGALGYTSRAQAAGNMVTFKRTMFVDTMMVDTKFYTPLRNFYSTMLTAEQKPLVLTEKK